MKKRIDRRTFTRSGLATLALAGNLPKRFAAATENDPATAWRCGNLRMIWDRAVDNEFTDLIRFRDRFFCVFREGLHHTSPDGKTRVLSSADGVTWREEALLSLEGRDLRDPKLSITPDGKLMLCTAAVIPEPYDLRSHVCFSDDGHRWGDLIPVDLPEGEWLWRVTWHEDKAYTVTRNLNDETRKLRNYRTRLYTSEDGVHYDVLVPTLYDVSGPNESTVRFGPEGTCYCLSRRHPPELVAALGASRPPYREWSWKPLDYFVGGPNFIRIPSGPWLASGRLRFTDAGSKRAKSQTAICRLDVERGKLTPVARLPGAGGYCGMVWHDGKLWVTTYSNHEGKKNRIYLAELMPRQS